VLPRTESTLVPEVSGVVVSVSPSWANGGFFKSGETLLKIEASDYELALVAAEAQVAQARVRIAREEQETAVALKEWESLGNDGEEPPPLVAHEPQLAEARALLESARAMKRRAELDLERTEIKAPYAGRVWQKSVDVGQYVSPGSPVARIYSVEKAEVRLPIADDELAYVDLPLDYRNDDPASTTRRQLPEVTLSAEFAGRKFTWEGKIVRTEGEIDPKSRRVHAVAQVLDPYGRGEDPDRPPLAVGLFVHAEIKGLELQDVIVLPRHALRRGGRVLIVDADTRLRFREVSVRRIQGEKVVIATGLENGERVCISPLDVVVDGMRVRLEGEPTETTAVEESTS
jgi:multidrug efflux system membrane fusion protein